MDCQPLIRAPEKIDWEKKWTGLKKKPKNNYYYLQILAIFSKYIQVILHIYINCSGSDNIYTHILAGNCHVCIVQSPAVGMKDLR